MSAFGDEEYYKLLELMLISTKVYSEVNDTTDFLLFTSSEFEPRVKLLLKRLELPVQTVVLDTVKTAHDAASCKMRIFEYANVNLYSKLLFLDIDIIVQGNLLDLFDLCKEDKLYAVNQATLGSHPGLGSTLFDLSITDRSTPAINTGVMLFNNSPLMKKLFADVNMHMAEFKEKGKELPPCYEQPFVNLHAITTNLHDLGALIPFIKLCQLDPVSPLENKQILINHFFDNLRGSSKSKRMSDYFTTLLNNYRNLAPISGTPSSLALMLVNKKYVWGSGSIMFGQEGVLRTTWTNGRYEVLSTTGNLVKASWAGFHHIIIFNDQFTLYTYIRLNDGFIGNGTLNT